MGSKIRIKNAKHLEKRLTKAIEYLKSIGCKEIIPFGSLSDGTFDRFSDIDLAISGISPLSYFEAVVVLSSLIGVKVDLVAMDYIPKEFEKRIRKHGKILYAAGEGIKNSSPIPLSTRREGEQKGVSKSKGCVGSYS